MRGGGVATAGDYRHALRDVARQRLDGVDRNLMAVELTKVALWIETIEPGKPLGFLDANIRCGDALLGVLDLEALRQGIPDEAYKPLTGDDKETTKHFAARNRAEKTGQGALDFGGGTETVGCPRPRPSRMPPGRCALFLRTASKRSQKSNGAFARRSPIPVAGAGASRRTSMWRRSSRRRLAACPSIATS